LGYGGRACDSRGEGLSAEASAKADSPPLSRTKIFAVAVRNGLAILQALQRKRA